MEMIKEAHFTKEIQNLILECRLPVSDLGADERFHYFTSGSAESPHGVVVLELLGNYGLLRSLSVRPAYRNRGTGEALITYLENKAAKLGVRNIYLLTTDAAGYFQRLNYLKTDRNNAPAEIQNSAQFKNICPSGAVLMEKVLPG